MTVHFPELSAEMVEERFRWARRRGYASWLWPDVPVENWRSAARVITDVVRKVLAGETDVVLACDDPQAASLVAYTSGIGPLLGCWIESGLVRTSQELADVFRLHLAHNRERMTSLSCIAREAVSKLTQAGIRPLVVKGMHTAFVISPNPVREHRRILTSSSPRRRYRRRKPCSKSSAATGFSSLDLPIPVTGYCHQRPGRREL